MLERKKCTGERIKEITTFKNYMQALCSSCPRMLVPQDWSAEKGLQYWAKECLETSWFGTL